MRGRFDSDMAQSLRRLEMWEGLYAPTSSSSALVGAQSPSHQAGSQPLTMKTLRLLLALGFVTTLASLVLRADDKAKEPAKCHGMACCNKKDKDGKASCATDGHACCCDTGEEKAKEEKSEPKK